MPPSEDLPVEPKPSPKAVLQWEVSPRINLAAQQNAIRVLSDIHLVNPSASPLDGCHLLITSEPAFFRPLHLRIDPVLASGSRTIGTEALRMDAEWLRGLEERIRADVILHLKTDSGGTLLIERREVEVLSPKEWSGIDGLPELLAAFVLPNDPALNKVLRVASDRVAALTKNPSLDGYQSRDPDRIRAIAQGIYEAVALEDLRYINPPASFETTGQKVRLPAETLASGLGTCVDLTLLFAALLEQAGLHPLLIIVQGHALPGVWLAERTLLTPATDDIASLRNRLYLGDIVLFDSSSVASQIPWEQAVARGASSLSKTEAFHFAVDVCSARQHRILPLQFVPSTPLSTEPFTPVETTAAPPVRAPSVLADEPLPAEVEASPKDRLDRWKSRLLDLTLRNKLIAFKDNKHSLPLAHVNGALAEDVLAEGKSLILCPRTKFLSEEDPRDTASHEALTGELAVENYHREQQERGKLFSSLTEREFEKRGLELFRANQLAMGESGAVTLYLTVGMLHWYERDDSQVLRRAPLLLVPVSLARRGKGRFVIQAADDETRANVTLLKKLQDDFDVHLPGVDPLPMDASGVDVPAVFRAFRQLATQFPRWEVSDACTLSQLQFTKFLMWLDLEAKTEHILKNAIVAHLFEGKGEAFPMVTRFPDLDQLDTAHPPSKIQPVASADPSQLQAVVAALEGNSFVLQGPPGTGKSQTITNMIASLLAAGRTVLFVSEKMAALDVVQRRLAGVGLGPFCLELHSRQANKKTVLASLAVALEASNTLAPDTWAAKTEQLESVSQQLNQTAELLRRPSPFQLTTQGVLEQLIALRDAPRIPLSPSLLNRINAAWLLRWQETARSLAVALKETGPPALHPWRMSRRKDWSPRLQREVELLLTTMGEQAKRLQLALDNCQAQLGLPSPPSTLQELNELTRVIRLLTQSVGPPPSLIAEASRQEGRQLIDELAELLHAHREAQEHVQTVFSPEISTVDLELHTRKLHQWQGVFFLIAWIMLFSTRRTLRAHLKEGAALPDDHALSKLLAEVRTQAEHRQSVLSHENDVRSIFGSRWSGLDTSPEALSQLADAAEAFANALQRLTGDLDISQEIAFRNALLPLFTTDFERVAATTPRGAKLLELENTVQPWTKSWTSIKELLGIERPARLSEQVQLVADLNEELSQNTSSLRDWCPLESAFSDLSELGLQAVADQLRSGQLSADLLEEAVQRSLLELWWEQKTEENPALGTFRGVNQEAVVQRFRELDDEVLSVTQQHIAATLARSIPSLDAPGSEMAVLKHQLQLQRRHTPLRKLFTKIPQLFRRLKPCVLMSPLSVAQFLDPALPGYDVVIFDEASQIPPWDAVGAIARGKQVVIVGDSKQLPPTSFFGSSGGEEEELDEDDRIDLDSILEEAISAGLPEHRLAWHYRSQHESLIAFSNHQYYDGRLRTFPSARHRVPALGVHLRPVPEGFYDRGVSRTNRAEAEAIVEEVRALAKLPEGERPTVGVVTFSSAQQRLIEDLLEEERGKNPLFEALFIGDEGLFVKNLENVQGDERDLILFSIGYGPDRQGRVSMNFGPLNKDGGERRLNVAVTRARKKVLVVSTLRADQIDLSRSRAVGVAHLKTYLAYAEQGFVAIDAAASVDPATETESPLETEIRDTLQEAGWTVHCQVGVSGYRIDLAVVDPDRPGAYLVGVECDGATYHSSTVARERDRLRQQVLESLGWRIERVWSTDWWHAREPTLRKLLATLDQHYANVQRERTEAIAASPPTPAPPLPKIPAIPEVEPSKAIDRVRQAIRESPDQRKTKPLPPYRSPDLPLVDPSLDFYSQAGGLLTIQMIQTLVNDGPIEKAYAWKLLREAWGFARMGRKIQQRFHDAIAGIAPEIRPRFEEDTLWPQHLSPESWTVVRVPGDSRPFEHIPLREIANAQAWLLEQAKGMDIDGEKMQREAAKLLGISGYRTRVRQRSEQATLLLKKMAGVGQNGPAFNKRR